MTKLEQMQAYARRIYDTTGSEDQWLEQDLNNIVTEVWNEAIKEERERVFDWVDVNVYSISDEEVEDYLRHLPKPNITSDK